MRRTDFSPLTQYVRRYAPVPNRLLRTALLRSAVIVEECFVLSFLVFLLKFPGVFFCIPIFLGWGGSLREE